MRGNLGLTNSYLKLGLALTIVGMPLVAASWHGVPPMGAARSMHVSAVLLGGGIVAFVIGCVVKVVSRRMPVEPS
ncbi:hypothetical protein [Stenotrophomonas sp. 24(2023)]|uniref:hypothetical protein n=1 Tax=Stenotrophomonas sp. 24(2023) TaxID=3068324 RepID=UPI0027E08341|nr:hypothetical protein [Stenotrophomonas sp. 24(2023)]WMJ70117.1 hypothetical protein Q9R17_03140 [Stenotrophomonas sp. 24(2023)]